MTSLSHVITHHHYRGRILFSMDMICITAILAVIVAAILATIELAIELAIVVATVSSCIHYRRSSRRRSPLRSPIRSPVGRLVYSVRRSPGRSPRVFTPLKWKRSGLPSPESIRVDIGLCNKLVAHFNGYEQLQLWNQSVRHERGLVNVRRIATWLCMCCVRKLDVQLTFNTATGRQLIRWCSLNVNALSLHARATGSHTTATSKNRTSVKVRPPMLVSNCVIGRQTDRYLLRWLKLHYTVHIHLFWVSVKTDDQAEADR